MHMQAKPVDQTKMLTLVALLSNYDMFRVNVDDGTEFYSTEIVNDEFGCLEFKKIFASSMYSDDIIVNICPISSVEYICSTAMYNYRISALHIKPKEFIKREMKEWHDIYDLVDISYISKQLSVQNKDSDFVTLVIDPYLLGELNPIEHSQIQQIINRYLAGWSKSMQIARTVYFQVSSNDFCNRIHTGIFDLGNKRILTKKLLFDNSFIGIMTDSDYKKIKHLLDYAKK